jgi:hypothetical protein
LEHCCVLDSVCELGCVGRLLASAWLVPLTLELAVQCVKGCQSDRHMR